MTLRRYAPLALAALAVACKPEIEKTDATVVNYVNFAPPTSLALPNDVALSSFLAGGTYAAAPCYGMPTSQTKDLCVYARSGGFPTVTPVTIPFTRGTLGAGGVVTYDPAFTTDPMAAATLSFANGVSTSPTIGIIDRTTGLPVTDATANVSAANTLTLAGPSGAWTAGHGYIVALLGDDRGPRTESGATYTVLPTFYILREAVIHDLDLTLPENQVLFPGDAATKAGYGAALEPLRASYRILYEAAGASFTALSLPFDQVISLQTFNIAPPATITVGDLGPSDPADVTVTGVATAMIDAFTLQSSITSAIVESVTFTLAAGAEAAVDSLTLNSASDCAAGTSLGSVTVSTAGAQIIPLTAWKQIGNADTVSMYVCATTKTPGASTAVSGSVTVTTANAHPGMVFVAAGSDSSATLTVNP